MDMPNDDFYQALRRKIRGYLADKGKAYEYADLLLAAPDLLHVLVKLMGDKRVPTSHKAALGVAIAYFVSPIDILPEFVLGPMGYIDDVALAAYVLHRLINAGHGAIAEEHWAGDGKLLHIVQRIVAIADAAVGKGLWQRLKRIGGIS